VTSDMSAIWCCCKTRFQGRVQLSAQSVRIALIVALLQANLLVIGCQSFMTLANWERALAVSGLLSILLGCVALYFTSSSSEAQPTSLEADGDQGFGWRWARIALFCFLANCIPGSSVSVGMLQYKVFSMESYQSLNLVSSFTCLCMSFAFGGCFRRWRISHMIAASTLTAVLAGLAPLPFAIMAMEESASSQKYELTSSLGALSVSASIVGSIATIFTVLPINTLVTSACGRESSDRSSTALAIFLSCYSFGATVGGLVSAPLLAAVGLDGENWKNLPAWITATACAKLFVLCLLPLLPPAPPTQHGGLEDALRESSTAGREQTVSLQEE